MSLQANAKWDNILRSFNVYVNTNLAATFTKDVSGDAIDWDGSEFNDAGYAFWLQPRLLEPARPEVWSWRVTTAVESVVRGQGTYIIANLNLFVRPLLLAASERSVKMAQLRDTVLGVFHPHSRIDVRDYAGDSSLLSSMKVDLISMDRAVTGPGLPDDLRQHVISPEMRWVEEWA